MTPDSPIHVPVLPAETLEYLDPQPTDTIVDATVGYGGHAAAILPHLVSGRYIGIDMDPVAIAHSRKTLDHPHLILIQAPNSEMAAALSKRGISQVQKILVDLGMSSVQLNDPARGFSFQREGPLDMRMNANDDQSAADILNTAPEDMLTEIFETYGEIRRPQRLVENILAQRRTTPIRTTTDLVSLIKKSFYFRNQRRLYIRTCAQVFQALRIATNDEIGHLQAVLVAIETLLSPGGRVVFLTFHSLEDRTIKQWLKAHKWEFKPLHSGVVKASQAEIKQNPRAHSARLRAIERV
jgi:16S rRNA (cytosine1402-N4)-methyltransferase